MGNLTARKRDPDLVITDLKAVFGRLSRDAEILELPAIVGFRPGWMMPIYLRNGVLRSARHRNCNQHRDRVVIRSGRGMAPAILDVAPLAGSGVEDRAEAVGRQRGGRG